MAFVTLKKPAFFADNGSSQTTAFSCAVEWWHERTAVFQRA
jgi:hypothetical protein